MNKDYVISLENKEGDYISLEGEILEEIYFPKVPLGGEQIFLHNSPTLIDYFKKRASPVEELQRRFSERTYVIKEVRFGQKNFITAIEKN
jgi:hypothetical protein